MIITIFWFSFALNVDKGKHRRYTGIEGRSGRVQFADPTGGTYSVAVGGEGAGGSYIGG